MFEKLKEFSGLAFGFVVMIGIFAVPVVFIMGSVWAAEPLFEPLIVIGWVAIAIDVVLLALSVFKGIRGFAGGTIFLSSFIFGLVTWLLGFVVTYSLWGLWAVIVGILFVGGGVVPIALLATLFKGMWDPFFTLLVLTTITFGSRVIGVLIAESAHR